MSILQATMKRFVLSFPIGLALSLPAVFGLFNDPGTWAMPLIFVAPWPIVSPLRARALDRRTRRAPDRLLRSIAVSA